MAELLKRALEKLVRFSENYAIVVLLLGVAFASSCLYYAKTTLQIRSDFTELLPKDSAGLKAYEHQLGRVGGGASFIVVVESPERASNERFIDDLSARLDADVKAHKACTSACKPGDDACVRACGVNLVQYFENGTKEVQTFYRTHKWLFATQKDLEDADSTLDHQISIQSGFVTDLESDDPPDAAAPRAPSKPSDAGVNKPTDAGAPVAVVGSDGGVAAPANAGSSDAGADGGERKSALGLDQFKDKWDSAAKKHDDFPTGYFASADGKTLVLRIITSAQGMGETSGDAFTVKMQKLVDELKSADAAVHRYHPNTVVGFAGDIPNAKAEKESIVDEAVWATGIALGCVALGIMFYFRSIASLLVVLVPVAVGIGAAYAYATFHFGYVNTAGAFLGAIIVGNGINYPIVLLARYREFKKRMTPSQARLESVKNAFRAELVGASVAGIAYGSLTITAFRGFSQFGAIGILGMFLVWVSIVPLVPAMVVLIEKVHPRFLAPPLAEALDDEAVAKIPEKTHGVVVRLFAWLTQRFPKSLVVLFLGITAVSAYTLPGFLRDPWEYNFHNLGSRGSKAQGGGGAGEWSNKADAVFQGKADISGARIMADTPEQVPQVKAKILEADSRDPQGKLISNIVTLDDFLPGTADEQKQKLEVLDRMRDRLTPRVLQGLAPEERKRVEEMMPPENLAAVTTKDVPALIRRRFEELNGNVGTLFYIQYVPNTSWSDGHTVLRIAKASDNVRLDDGTVVQTASRPTIYAEMIRSLEHDGPLATLVSFLAVIVVVVLATHQIRGAAAVLLALLMGVVCTVGVAAHLGLKLNFLNFVALPITFGIGCEYPFNIFDRTRLLGGDVRRAVLRSGGAVVLCSYTTIVGYGSLLVSDNQALQSFGYLAVAGEVACIVMAMLFLPALLHLILPKPGEKPPPKA
jgi:predicted RND superfamily exporter protein